MRAGSIGAGIISPGIVRYIYKGCNLMKPWVKVVPVIGKYQDTSTLSFRRMECFLLPPFPQGWIGEGFMDRLSVMWHQGNRFYPLLLSTGGSATQRTTGGSRTLAFYFSWWLNGHIDKVIVEWTSSHQSENGRWRRHYRCILWKIHKGIYIQIGCFYAYPAHLPMRQERPMFRLRLRPELQSLISTMDIPELSAASCWQWFACNIDVCHLSSNKNFQ